MRPTPDAQGSRPARAGDRLQDGLPEVAQPLQALSQGAASGTRPGGEYVWQPTHTVNVG